MNTKVVGMLNIPGRHESACRIHDPDYICPTINTMGGGGLEPKVIMRERESKPTLVGGVGEMKSNNGTQYYQQDRVYDSNEIALCQSAHEEFNPYYKVYPCLTPNREKKRQNGPRFRKEDSEMFTLTGQDIHGVGIAYDEQNGYFRKDGTVGTLTSDGSLPKHNNRIVEGINMEENKPSFRIRRLTPRECWRLMGFTDEDFDKAKQVNSDSQLYKQAGNSIVVDVLEAIFGEML